MKTLLAATPLLLALALAGVAPAQAASPLPADATVASLAQPATVAKKKSAGKKAAKKKPRKSRSPATR